MDINEVLLMNWLEDQGISSVSRLRLPSEDFEQGEQLPALWQQLLIKQLSPQAFVQEVWLQQAGMVHCADMMSGKLQSIALADMTRGGLPCLLYIFSHSNAITAFAAGQAVSTFPEIIPPAIQRAISPVYALHNGFIDLDDELTGLKPIEDVYVLEPDEGKGKESFLSVFEVGPNMMGFDLTEPEARAYILWGAEDEVEEVDDFQNELDEWLADQLEEFD